MERPQAQHTRIAKLNTVLNKALSSSLRSRASTQVLAKTFAPAVGAENQEVAALCSDLMGGVHRNIEVRHAVGRLSWLYEGALCGRLPSARSAARARGYPLRQSLTGAAFVQWRVYLFRPTPFTYHTYTRPTQPTPAGRV